MAALPGNPHELFGGERGAVSPRRARASHSHVAIHQARAHAKGAVARSGNPAPVCPAANNGGLAGLPRPAPAWPVPGTLASLAHLDRNLHPRLLVNAQLDLGEMAGAERLANLVRVGDVLRVRLTRRLRRHVPVLLRCLGEPSPVMPRSGKRWWVVRVWKGEHSLL
eukprot:scaffold26721_cov84-Isochrysis_galbana.AAC.1